LDADVAVGDQSLDSQAGTSESLGSQAPNRPLSGEDPSMIKMLAMVLGPVLALAALAPVAAQWKPEIRFLKIGVSSAGGDWFRAGAKFSTMIPSVLPDVASSTIIGGGVINVTRIG
jgi:hypothetical protein